VPTNRLCRALVLAACAVLVADTAIAQQRPPLDRLALEQLDVVPPSDRVSGAPGRMTLRQTPCRTLPDTQVRRRIVDVAVQEWAFFGFSTIDQTRIEAVPARRPRRPRGFRWLNVEESARVAGSIAGYWTVTPEGRWIVDDQNKAWNGPDGIGARWRAPWSAAFVSWVMCEGGLGDSTRFQRAIAHHTYIDQAIRARANDTSRAAFAAYDIGEAVVEPGDLLCSARRPGYRVLADRRRQMGEGARTHCDIVVSRDDAAGRLFAIGGNVRGVVSLKMLAVTRDAQGRLHPVSAAASGGRGVFAHLKLRTPPIEALAFDHSPTVKTVSCTPALEAPPLLAAASAVPAEPDNLRC
jgi:hypothetical protein